MTERRRLISRIASAVRATGKPLDARTGGRFVAEWLDGYKAEGEMADRLGVDVAGRWTRFVGDVIRHANGND